MAKSSVPLPDHDALVSECPCEICATDRSEQAALSNEIREKQHTKDTKASDHALALAVGLSAAMDLSEHISNRTMRRRELRAAEAAEKARKAAEKLAAQQRRRAALSAAKRDQETAEKTN